jgi:ceramide glucosyltransferase
MLIAGKVMLAIAVIGTISSTIVLVLSLLGARKYLRDIAAEKWPPLIVPPGVSVLKPVHGLEWRLREHLETYFNQDYPKYELIFCARSRDDAALKIVDELIAKYPHVDARVITSGDPPAANAKVHSLATMIEAAQYEILLFSDSDVPARPEYVREVTAPLNDRRVGVTNCLYRGLPQPGFWALVDALGMTIEMPAGVLIARMLEGMKFALGPTLAARKDVIDKIGGMRQFQDYCAEDFEIGRLADAAGFRVVLSSHVIDHVSTEGDFKRSFRHQIRWMLSSRYSRPAGHLGTIFTFAAPFGLLGLISGIMIGQPAFGLFLLTCSWLNRAIQAIAIGWGTLSDPLSLKYAWLYWLRDLQGFFVWCASYAGNEVVWRGRRYRLTTGGKMILVA